MLKLYPANIGQEILESYSAALRRIWIIALCLGCSGLIGSALIEWRSVKRNSGPSKENNSRKNERPEKDNTVQEKV